MDYTATRESGEHSPLIHLEGSKYGLIGKGIMSLLDQEIKIQSFFFTCITNLPPFFFSLPHKECLSDTVKVSI